MRPVGPLFLVQACGLIAVGQRLAPLSKAPTLSRKAIIEKFFSGGDVLGAQCRNFIAVRMLVRTCKQVVFLCDAVHVCLVFLQTWSPSTCHLKMTFACHVCQTGGVLSRSRCCGAHVHPSCRDPDQLCFFCADMDCNAAAPDEGSFVLCTLDQVENNSLILPCCRNGFHVGCFVQSVQHCRTQCPFCSPGCSTPRCCHGARRHFLSPQSQTWM